jgi:hypothetical protein
LNGDHFSSLVGQWSDNHAGNREQGGSLCVVVARQLSFALRINNAKSLNISFDAPTSLPGWFGGRERC